MNLWRRIFKYLPLGLKIKLLDWYLKKEGIVVKIAQTPEEKEQVYRLRWEVYAAEDYIDPDDYPDRRLEDEYDEHAVSFLALQNGEPAGTVRLIKNSDLGLPTERAFNILNLPSDIAREQLVCLSKLGVRREFRGALTSSGLLHKALDYSREAGIEYWLFDTTPRLAVYFRDLLGVPLLALATGPAGPEQLKERDAIAKRYFRRFRLRPYLLSVGEVLRL